VKALWRGAGRRLSGRVQDPGKEPQDAQFGRSTVIAEEGGALVFIEVKKETPTVWRCTFGRNKSKKQRHGRSLPLVPEEA
jgi:hypothetical protein